jgi:hypothetical protein
VSVFWDTNVFVYAFIAGPKHQIARRGAHRFAALPRGSVSGSRPAVDAAAKG